MSSPSAPLAHVAELRCLRCGAAYPPDVGAYLCPACDRGDGIDAGVLEVVYDYGAVAAFPGDGAGAVRGDVFRYAPLLPVDRPERAVLAAGGTPLVSAPGLARRFGLKELWLKDETANPTRCLKDRATTIALAMADAAGRDTLFCASAGNAAISLAGFCAHAGLRAHVWVPARASSEQLAWLQRFGATVHVAAGDYDFAYDQSEAEGRTQGWYSRNCAFNPYLVEGKKTVAFEIAEQLGWRAPDLVLAPVGDGCTLSAAGKGFRELREIGRTDALPRLVGAQAEGVQPLVHRLTGEDGGAEGSTRAASIAVRNPRNALRLLRELDTAGGTLLAVPDEETDRACATLSREAGLVCEFTSAAPLAALAHVAEAESLEGKTAVLIVTSGRAD
ncbi:MAG TPA: pyridoxal-phosphate dependent enzyme [Longimicrobium sp.]